MRLAESVAADDERDGFFVVHRHVSERLADVLGGRDRVGVAVRPFRIDVDQAHLSGPDRLFEDAALVAIARHELGAPQ